MIRHLTLALLVALPLAAGAQAPMPAERIAALERQVAEQAETIAALEAALAERLDPVELGTLRARLRNQTLRIATLEGDIATCRRARGEAEAGQRRAQDDARRLDASLGAVRAQLQRAEADGRRSEDARRRAERDVQRLHGELMRCR